MFRKAKNIDTAFQELRLFCLVIIMGCLSLCGYSVYKMAKATADANSRVYILANGKALEALGMDRKDDIPVEARDHIRTFHHYFFSLDPDDKVIQGNLTKALYLADESAKRMYDNLRENNYYANVISGNISQQVTVDSIRLDVNQYPFYFVCFATEKIIRTTSIVTRSLVTEGFLRNVARSDNNPHGFLIERFNTLENKDLSVEVR
jgi:conjugative transposon TraK protein